VRRFLPLVLLSLSPAFATPDEKVEPKPPLAIEAEVTKSAQFAFRQLVVRQVNTGKTPLTVVTNKLR
jgi:hypothetical protein